MASSSVSAHHSIMLLMGKIIGSHEPSDVQNGNLFTLRQTTNCSSPIGFRHTTMRLAECRTADHKVVDEDLSYWRYLSTDKKSAAVGHSNSQDQITFRSERLRHLTRISNLAKRKKARRKCICSAAVDPIATHTLTRR